MNIPESTLEKLKKILRLAANDGATQGEAEAALARAKEIAMQHDIDLASIDITDPNAQAKTIKVEKGQVAFSSEHRYYHACISRVLKEVFGVYIVKLGRAYALIGDKHDVASAREIFIWLEDLYPKAFRKMVTDRVLSQCAEHRNGFYHGFTDGLLAANKRAVKETLAKQSVDANKYAVVLRNKETAIMAAVPTFFPKLIHRSSSRKHDGGAHEMGMAQGSKIRLHQTGGGRGAAGQLS